MEGEQPKATAPLWQAVMWSLFKMIALLVGGFWLINWGFMSYFDARGPQTDASIGGGGAGEGIIIVFTWLLWFVFWIPICVISVTRAIERNKRNSGLEKSKTIWKT